MQHVQDIIRHPHRRRTSSLDNSSEYNIKPLSPDPVLFTMTSTQGGVNPDDPADDFCLIEALPKDQAFNLGLNSAPQDPQLDLRALRKKLASLEDGNDEVAGKGGGSEREQVDNSVQVSHLVSVTV